MSRASVAKSLCLGAAVVALVWLALGCGGGGNIIPGTNPVGAIADRLVGSYAVEIYVDPASGTVMVNDNSVSASEAPLRAGTGAGFPVTIGLESGHTDHDGNNVNTLFDPMTSAVRFWLTLTNNSAYDINDVIVVPGNYVGKVGNTGTNAVIPNVLNLQPFGLLNNHLVPQFGNQPYQGYGFSGDYDAVQFGFGGPGGWLAGPERDGDPSFSPRDDPDFFPTGTGPQTTYGAGCWQLVPNPAYSRANDRGLGGDGRAFDARLSPYNSDDNGNTEALARVCSGSKPTVANCISAMWLGQLAGNTTKAFQMQIRDPAALAFSFLAVVWASRFHWQNLTGPNPLPALAGKSADLQYQAVSAQNISTAVAVGETDGSDVMISMTTDGENWFRQPWSDDWGAPNSFTADMNGVVLNKVKRIGTVNPAIANITANPFPGPAVFGTPAGSGLLCRFNWRDINGDGLITANETSATVPAPLTPLPPLVTETGEFGVAVGVSHSGSRMVFRTLGGTVWRAADSAAQPQDFGMITNTAMNDVAAALENGWQGNLATHTSPASYQRLASTLLVAVGDYSLGNRSGAVMVSTDAGDTWFNAQPNERGDRTRSQETGGDRYSSSYVIPMQTNNLCVAADPKPSGVRIGEVQFDPNALVAAGGYPFYSDPVLNNILTNNRGGPGQAALAANPDGIAQAELTAWGNLKAVNNHRTFVGCGNGVIMYSDDCLTPTYTPSQGGMPADEVPSNYIPAPGQAPKAPIPAFGLVDAKSAWQTTWDDCVGTGGHQILDVKVCEIADDTREFGTRLIVMACTDQGEFYLCEDGRGDGLPSNPARPPWAISTLIGVGAFTPPAVVVAPTGTVRVTGGGTGPSFNIDTAITSLVGGSSQPGAGPNASHCNLRAISCNPWDLCPQALNDNDNWSPEAAGSALQVWVVGQQCNTAPLHETLRQAIVLHNPALVSSRGTGWPVPVVAAPGAPITATLGTLGALVGSEGKKNGPGQQSGLDPIPPATPSYAHGWWTVLNPQANIIDAGGTGAHLAADLNGVDCANPVGTKEAYMRTVVPSFPTDKSPVPCTFVDTNCNGQVDPGELVAPVVNPNIPVPGGGPPPTITMEQPGWRWIDLDGDGFVDPHPAIVGPPAALNHLTPGVGPLAGNPHANELFATVIIPDNRAPLIWPTAYVVGGLPGVGITNGHPGYSVSGKDNWSGSGWDLPHTVWQSLLPAVPTWHAGTGHSTGSYGVIRAYY